MISLLVTLGVLGGSGPETDEKRIDFFEKKTRHTKIIRRFRRLPTPVYHGYSWAVMEVKPWLGNG